MRKFLHPLTPLKLASSAVILALLTGSVYYWYNGRQKDQMHVDSIERDAAGRHANEALLRVAKQFKEAGGSDSASPAATDPLSAEDQQSMKDETEQIKAWHKLTPEQQALEAQKLTKMNKK